MPVDFGKYLHVPVDDNEAPKAPPVGHYYAAQKSWKAEEVDYKQGNGLEAIVVLTFSLTGADDDVDPSSLDGIKIAGVPVTKNYSLETEMHVLRAVGEKTMGIPTKGLDLEQLLNAMNGQEVKLFLEQRMGKEGSATEGRSFSKVSKVLPVGG